MAELKPFAFVLMPFDEEFDDVYKVGVQEVARSLGVVAERVDEQTFSETILERIYRQIEAADFIIADMTGRNPNVFYEVGFAHAKGKPCILLTQRVEDIPFDLKHHRHLVYSNSITTLREQLSSEVTWLIGEIAKNKKQTISIQLRSTVGYLNKTDWSDQGEVEITLDMHNRTDRRSPEIEAIYFHTGDGWRYSQGSETCASATSELGDYKLRHFIKPPVTRLSPGAWAQIKLKGRKTVWNRWRGDERKDSYRLTGRALLEIVTSEGSLREVVALDVEVDEIPF